MNRVGSWFMGLLADATPSPSPTSNEPDAALVSPGWLGFISLVFLGVTVFVIWKSLNRQLKKIDFDEAATERPRKKSDASASTVGLATESAAASDASPLNDDASDAKSPDLPIEGESDSI